MLENAPARIGVPSEEFQRLLKRERRKVMQAAEAECTDKGTMDTRVLVAVEINKQVYVGTVKRAAADFSTGEINVWHPIPIAAAQAATKRNQGIPPPYIV